MSKAEQTSHPVSSSQDVSYPWHVDSWQKFQHACQIDHLSHALLISGAEHTGKFGFASKIAKSMLCESPSRTSTESGACNQCRSCKTYESKANPDYLQIDLLEDKQQIGVDQIRKMNQFLTLSRSFNTYRVVVISEAERMNKNAANSLLKSLEEPADNSVIILVTSHLSVMIPTIKSRCQLLHLPTPGKPQAIDWLKQKTGMDESLLAQKLDIAQNRPLAALNIDEELINSRELLLEDIINIIQEKLAITDIAKKWHKHDHTMLLDWQIGWLHQLLSSEYQSSNKSNDNQQLNQKLPKNLMTIKESAMNIALWDLYDQLLQQKRLVHTSVNPLIFLENMLTLWLQAKHC